MDEIGIDSWVISNCPIGYEHSEFKEFLITIGIQLFENLKNSGHSVEDCMNSIFSDESDLN